MINAEITCDTCGQTIASINDNEVSTLTSLDDDKDIAINHIVVRFATKARLGTFYRNFCNYECFLKWYNKWIT